MQLFGLFGKKIIIFGEFFGRFLTVMMNFYLFTHIFACLYVVVEDLDNAVFDKSIYIQAIYFIYQTSTVVGYGDETVDLQSPLWFGSRVLFATSVMFFGIIFVGYSFGCINQSIAKLKEIAYKTNSQLEELEDWYAMRRRGNPEAFSYRFEVILEQFYASLFRYDIKVALSYQDMLEKLPVSIIHTINETSTQEVESLFRYYFRDISPELADAIILESSPVAYSHLTQLHERRPDHQERRVSSRRILHHVWERAGLQIPPAVLNEAARTGARLR